MECDLGSFDHGCGVAVCVWWFGCGDGFKITDLRKKDCVCESERECV